jgi:flagellar basal body-associated protein FliL
MAKLIRCRQGHVFDAEKHAACPVCGEEVIFKASDDGETDGEKASPPPALKRTIPLIIVGAVAVLAAAAVAGGYFVFRPVNKKLWDGFTPSDRALIEMAAAAEFSVSLAQFNVENGKALRALRADQRIKITRFNDELIRVFGKTSKEVIADTAAKDPMTRKVVESYQGFLAGVMDWGELSETGYRDTRRLALR